MVVGVEPVSRKRIGRELGDRQLQATTGRDRKDNAVCVIPQMELSAHRQVKGKVGPSSALLLEYTTWTPQMCRLIG